MHNQIQAGPLKRCSSEVLTNALKTVPFPNYNIFLIVNVDYLDRLNKISVTVDNVAPIKKIRIRNNTKTSLNMRFQKLYM